MKVEELRIGNFVESLFGIFRIISINKEGEVFCNNTKTCFHCYIDKIKPVIITPELLKKCGFKKDRNDNYTLSWDEVASKIRTIEFEFVDTDIASAFWIGKGTDKMLIDIEYLHQLQNFYYALTNKELEVKL